MQIALFVAYKYKTQAIFQACDYLITRDIVHGHVVLFIDCAVTLNLIRICYLCVLSYKSIVDFVLGIYLFIAARVA